jgi:hypothetical protein
MASFSFFKVNVNVQYAHLEHSFYYQVASSYFNSKVTNILQFIFILLLETSAHGYMIRVTN